MLQNKSYLTTSTETEYDLGVYDPPFLEWCNIKKLIKAKSYICFTNEKSREHTVRIFGEPTFVFVWHYTNADFRGFEKPRNSHEYVFVYGDLGKKCNTGEFNHSRKEINKGRKHPSYIPKEQKLLTSVFTPSKSVKNGGHIWAKPEYMLIQLMDWLTEPDDIIWDGFAGTGNIGIVAKKLHCRYEGYEIDPDMYDLANRRIDETECESRKIEILKAHIEHDKKDVGNIRRKLNDKIKAIDKMKTYLKEERSKK